MGGDIKLFDRRPSPRHVLTHFQTVLSSFLSFESRFSTQYLTAILEKRRQAQQNVDYNAPRHPARGHGQHNSANRQHAARAPE
jgi:hypothetical protein